MKRKVLSLTLAAIMALSLVTAAAPSAQASGTAESPFIVSTAATLRKVGSGEDGWTMDAHYKQIADIDISSYTNWMPIGGNGYPGTPGANLSAAEGYFVGTYDGGGFVITGLTINRTGYANEPKDHETFGVNQGLFNNIRDGGVVKNLGLENINITARSYAGGIAGVNESGGTISNCYVTGKITGGGTDPGNFGGIVGQNSGLIEFCYSTAEISADKLVGGIASVNLSGAIKRSVSLNTSVTTKDASTAVFRIAKKDSGTYEENYASESVVLKYGSTSLEKTTYIIEEDGHDITAEQVKKPETWIELGWDFEETWTIKSGGSRPTFQSGGGKHNIAYVPSSALVTATPVKDAAHSTDPNTYTADSAIIDLDAEKLTLPSGFTVAAFSIDGGGNWKSGAPPAEFSKLLGKDLTLHLSNLEIDRATKKPIAGKAAEGETAAVPGATIIAFAKIAARPSVTKLTVNYSIYPDNTSETPGQWTLTPKNATEASDLSGLQIAVAASNKKDPDEDGWGRFRGAQGINVMPTEAGQKPAKTVYLVRGAPVGGNDGNAKAASKLYKVTASGQLAQPKIKVNYKLENIKPKVGMSLSGTGIETVIYAKGTPELKGVSIESAIGAAEGSVRAWMTATAKKPASRIQNIKLAPRIEMPEEAVAIPAPNGKIKLDSRKYEIWNATSKKWGGLPALTASPETIENVRLKATAKADKPGTGYSDLSASIDGSIHIYWGKNSNGGDAVLAAWFLAPGVDVPEPPEDVVIQLPETSADPVIETQPQPITMTKGGADGQLTVVATGTGILSYQWYRNGSTITNTQAGYTGANSATLTILNDANLAEHSYNVRVTHKEDGKNAKSLTSAIVKVTVVSGPSAAPTITAQPQNATGDSVTLSVTATAPAGGTLTYQWFDSNADKSFTSARAGATGTSLTTNVGGPTYIFVRVTNTEPGKAPMSVDSDLVTLNRP